jgi:hypothetical protein
MKYNEINTIVDSVLTDEEIKTIYSIIEDSRKTYLMELFNQQISDFQIPEEISKKIIKKCEELSGESNLEISEYQFSTYEKIKDEDGKVRNPLLFPHYDSTFPEPRFTFDYQIGGNTTWPLVVEDTVFELKNNQALTFSGTHQIHWRLKKDFKEGERIDMIFFHLRKIGADKKDISVNQIMHEKEGKFRKAYDEEGESYDRNA